MPPASRLDLVVDHIDSDEGEAVDGNVERNRNAGRSHQAIAGEVVAASESEDVEVLNYDGGK